HQILSPRWRKLLVIAAGASICVYSASVLWYVQSVPDIGLRCTFSPEIKHLDDRYLDPGPQSPSPQQDDVLVQVGDRPIEGAGPQVWSQILLLRALISLRDT